MTGLIKIRPACSPVGDASSLGYGSAPPLPWDPSDTRGIDPDPSCLPHALALAYPLHLLISYYKVPYVL